jgi:predicted DNA-binding transcriptional regulator YafY
MAKQDYIFRHLTIIKKLRNSKEATFNEIREYLKRESEFLERRFSLSIRTFERDRNEIHTLYNVDIQFDFSKKVYYIANDQQSDLNNRMLESMDLINSLKMVSDISGFMIFEKRKAMGTHHFHGLIHAIKNRIVIKLVHQKFEYDEPTERLVEPLALKESRGRWYLAARGSSDNKLKTFGLDRILSFENTPGRFDYPRDLDVNEIFRDCFGIINPDHEKPEDIILSFTPDQGKYIKTYPLHESQKIIKDTSDELRITLHLYITHDLMMEMLSHGDSVEVIEPKKLREAIIAASRNTFQLYEKL